MAVFYEWCVETVTKDKHEDIEDLDFRDRFEEVKYGLKDKAPDGFFYRIALCRKRYAADDPGDLVCSSWAYLEGGKLPERFEDAYNNPVAKVPQRFHREVAT